MASALNEFFRAIFENLNSSYEILMLKITIQEEKNERRPPLHPFQDRNKNQVMKGFLKINLLRQDFTMFRIGFIFLPLSCNLLKFHS